MTKKERGGTADPLCGEGLRFWGATPVDAAATGRGGDPPAGISDRPARGSVGGGALRPVAKSKIHAIGLDLGNRSLDVENPNQKKDSLQFLQSGTETRSVKICQPVSRLCQLTQEKCVSDPGFGRLRPAATPSADRGVRRGGPGGSRRKGRPGRELQA